MTSIKSISVKRLPLLYTRSNIWLPRTPSPSSSFHPLLHNHRIKQAAFASTNTATAPRPRIRHTVKVTGPEEECYEDHKRKLVQQLEDIPRDVTALRIEDETPSDTEWGILGARFPQIRNLEFDTGFNEALNDREMPLAWPLQRLRIGSAGAEVIQSPWIRQGRIAHLILFLTCGLRFEGPTTKELSRMNKEATDRGEKKKQTITVKEGTPEERQIEMVFIPELVTEWMNRKYGGSRSEECDLDPENQPPSTPMQLQTLEVLENDAMDTFVRMTLALPHLVDNLKTLNIRSTHGLDFGLTNEDLFRQILPQLSNLRTLRLSVGEVFTDPEYLSTLHRRFPPNLTSLYFRGPTSLCQSKHWDDWLIAFQDTQFLPQLRHLGFVLDLHYEQREDENWTNKKKECRAPDEILDQARSACQKLYSIARQRGVSVEPVYDEWSDQSQILRQVDDRW